MSEIEFKEEASLQNIRRVHQNKKVTSLGSFLIKLSDGHIKDQRQANKVLMIIIITLFVYSAYLLVTKIFI